jgi:hypothetical protein
MKKPITPEGRLERWKKLWATPRILSDTESKAEFEEFVEAFVPGHMEKKFRQFFGTPRAKFGNRFFRDGAVFQSWDTALSGLGLRDVTHAEATVIYGSPEGLEATWLRGELRRTLRDIVVDDWHAACVIVRAGEARLYAFVEPKMRGCIVLWAGSEDSE